MPTKQEKRMVIRQLLIPILLIIAALLYQPVKNFFYPTEKPAGMKSDGGNLTVSYIDVGQGDATLISKGNFHMLIDAGKNEKGTEVVSYLKSKNISTIDIVVGTHPDSDHIGGVDDVLDNFKVKTVYLPEMGKATKTYREVEAALKRSGKKDKMPEIGRNYTYDGNVVVRFLGPVKQSHDANNNSLVVQLAYGRNRFLFMGDAEEKEERDIVKQQYDLECDVLKVGHHGSGKSTSDAFLSLADPSYAVISCGKNNSYGHPHAEVLSRLSEDDVQIYRTDTMGTVEAVSDGSLVRLSTEHSSEN